MRRLLDDGYSLVRRGMPNFVARRGKDEVYLVFVERNGKLTEKQQEMQELFEEAGIPTAIVGEDGADA